MATAEQRKHVKSFLTKAEEYLASAEDNLAAERHTPAAGDAIHAGISSNGAPEPCWASRSRSLGWGASDTSLLVRTRLSTGPAECTAPPGSSVTYASGVIPRCAATDEGNRAGAAVPNDHMIRDCGPPELDEPEVVTSSASHHFEGRG